MKKILYLIKNEQAFSLPYILFIVTIIFLIVPANILTYRNEIDLTERQLEQIKIETLYQMARAEITSDFLSNEEVPSKIKYNFPHGTVTVNSSLYGIKNYMQLKYDIVTEDSSSTYSFVKKIDVDPQKHMDNN